MVSSWGGRGGGEWLGQVGEAGSSVARAFGVGMVGVPGKDLNRICSSFPGVSSLIGGHQGRGHCLVRWVLTLVVAGLVLICLGLELKYNMRRRSYLLGGKVRNPYHLARPCEGRKVICGQSPCNCLSVARHLGFHPGDSVPAHRFCLPTAATAVGVSE